MCNPGWNPTVEKLNVRLPAELGLIPATVLVNGENWLSMATKKAAAGSNPVPKPVANKLESLA